MSNPRAYELLQGDARSMLWLLPRKSVQTCITSPPYYQCRNYGIGPSVWAPALSGNPWDKAMQELRVTYPADFALCSERGHTWVPCGVSRNRWGLDKGVSEKQQSNRGNAYSVGLGEYCCSCGAWRGTLGNEPTPELYVEHLVQIFREVREALRDDGTIWLNLGDCYFKTGTGQKSTGKHGYDMETFPQDRPSKHPVLKPKDLCGIPWRVAFALQRDGWYLRSCIIWDKPNAMCRGGVRDRPTESFEYIFLLSKRGRYYYDQDAVREPYAESTRREARERYNGKATKDYGGVGAQDPSETKRRASAAIARQIVRAEENGSIVGRNRRSVWRVNTKSFKGAHTAVFPLDLIEPCILAATSEKGECRECGSPWVRQVHRRRYPTHIPVNPKGNPDRRDNGNPERFMTDVTEIGWQPSCGCLAGAPVPQTVLDPFMGSGTTGVAALMHGRRFVGIDVKSEYIEMADERIQNSIIEGAFGKDKATAAKRRAGR